MKKVHYYSIASCLIVGLFTVIALHYYSLPDNHKVYAFERNFTRKDLTLLNIQDIKFNSYYFAGVSGGCMYLGNFMAPMHMLAIDTACKDTTFISLTLKSPAAKDLSRSVQLKVRDTLFYVIDGSLPGIFKGRINEWVAERFIYDSVYFIRAEPTSPTDFAFMAMGKTQENVLGRLTAQQPHVSILNNHLKKQLDGIFCTDGDFICSQDPALLIFLYRYRNDYLVMNHKMEILHHGKTIDPINVAQIKPYNLGSEGSVTLANPGGTVNYKGAAHGQLLFIQSNVQAQNDDPDAFSTSSVIDIYDMVSLNYLQSFYVPEYGGKKLRDFIVLKNMLIALYDHQIVRYRLDSNYPGRDAQTSFTKTKYY